MKKKREGKYSKFARLALGLAQEEYAAYSHPKSPRKFRQPQLVACILLMHYMRLSYRDMEEFLYDSDNIVKVLKLKEIPDYSTLQRAARRIVTLEKLDGLNRRLLERLAVEEEGVAVDATGFQMTQASSHYRTRRGQKVERYWKGFYAVGVRTLLILGRTQCLGPSHDGMKLNTLRRAVTPFVRSRGWVLLGDAGFDLASQVRPGDLIPPRPTGRTRAISAPDRRARADLVNAARLDGLFGQRWKVECVFSVIKRKFGDAIRARKPLLQNRETAIKMVVYNIHV